LADRYPLSEEGDVAEIAVHIGDRPILRQGPLQRNYKLRSADASDTLMLQPNILAVSRLPPYPGWEVVAERFARDFQDCRPLLGNPQLVRVGVRYINRIDVPAPGPIRVEDFLRFFPHLADRDEQMSNYAMQVVLPIAGGAYNATLNSATVPSPMIGHHSFIVDIDISREGNLPRKLDALLGLLEEIREHKNQIFESCITDQSRALFDR
jgi:uncharacterized protein (TIGR04255 family)